MSMILRKRLVAIPLALVALGLSGCTSPEVDPPTAEVTSLDDYHAKVAEFGRETAECMQEAGFDTRYNEESGTVGGSGTADTAAAQNEALTACRTSLELELGLMPVAEELPDSVRAENYGLLEERYNCLLQQGVPLEPNVPSQQTYFSDSLSMSPEEQLGPEVMQEYLDELFETCPVDARAI